MKTADDTKELVDLITYSEVIKTTEVENLKLDIAKAGRRLDLLLDHAELGGEDMKLNAATFTWPRRILPILDMGRKHLTQRKDAVQEELRAKLAATSKDLDQVMEEVTAFQDFGIMNEMPEYLKKITDLEGRLRALGRTTEFLNNEEALLGWEKSPFEKHAAAVAYMEPYKKLWDTTAFFQTEYGKWLNGPFIELNPQAIDDDISNITRTVFGLNKIFTDTPIPRKVTENIRTKLEKFRQYLPLITVLRSPGLKDRHWEQMNGLAGQVILPEPSTTPLSKVIELNLAPFMVDFEKIADVATKQFSLQRGLDKMKDAWGPLVLESIEYRDSGTRILSSIEEIELVLGKPRYEVIMFFVYKSPPRPLPQRIRLLKRRPCVARHSSNRLRRNLLNGSRGYCVSKSRLICGFKYSPHGCTSSPSSVQMTS